MTLQRCKETSGVEMKEAIKHYISQHLLNNESMPEDDDNLLASGMVDSLGMVRLLEFIEEQFHIQVPPEDLTIEHFGTINVMTDYLQQHSGR